MYDDDDLMCDEPTGRGLAIGLVIFIGLALLSCAGLVAVAARTWGVS